MPNLENLYRQALNHRTEHNCSAPPYEHYARLVEIVKQFRATKILEIGTGMGFTSTVMASQSPDIYIDTIEKDPEHVSAAKEFFKNNGVAERIKIQEGSAEQILAGLPQGYDLIFFDGYQIHYEFLPHYERLLKPTGILFLANNHLQSKTSERFFEELHTSGKWQILEQFADTTIARKL